MISRKHPVLKVVWAVGIVTITIYSVTAFDPGHFAAHVWDKLGHFLAYFGVGIIGFLAATTARHRLQIAIGMLVLGLALEILQFYTPTRQFEWADWLADAMGVALAFGIYLLLRAGRRRKRLD